MTQVTGTITYPDGSPLQGASVKYTLIGASRAFVSADDETVAGTQPTITVDAAGEYTIDVPGNPTMAPVGTMWRRHVSARGIEPFYDDLIVPGTGGPYVEENVLAEPVSPVPAPTATALVDRAEITVSTAPLAVTAFTVAAVPLLVVDIPDLGVPVMIRAQSGLDHSTAAGGAGRSVSMSIAPVGSDLTGLIASNTFWQGDGQPISGSVEAFLPAGSPGSYQLFVSSATSGNVVATAASFSPAWIYALAA